MSLEGDYSVLAAMNTLSVVRKRTLARQAALWPAATNGTSACATDVLKGKARREQTKRRFVEFHKNIRA